MKEERPPTRTLLVTGFPRGTTHDDILRLCREEGEVREHFVINNKYSVLFVVFYDLRDSEKACKRLSREDMGGKPMEIKYTINKTEVPRGGDTCDENKGQGRVVARDTEKTEEILAGSGSVKRIEKRGSEVSAEFYDSRDASAALVRLQREGIDARPGWDHGLRERRAMFSEADEIVRNAVHGYFKGAAGEEKRHVPAESRKRHKENHWMVSLFDEFLRENSRDLEELLEKELHQL
jgi:RNA recognition motif-containing protein